MIKENIKGMKQISNNRVNILTLGKDNDIDIAQSVRKLVRSDGIMQHHIDALDSNLTKTRMAMTSKLNTVEMKIKILTIGLIWSYVVIVLMITHVIK